MFSHDDIWDAIDRIAKSVGISPSALARQAGLDPTSFNKSKRVLKNGKARWPTTESLSKVLAVVGMSLEDFALIAEDNTTRGPSVPLIGLAQAGDSGYFDDAGFPVGAGWDEVRVPGHMDEHVYALEISGDSMLPVFRHGDRVLVSPGESIRRGDRVVVKTCEGEIMAKELARMTETRIELRSVNPDYGDRTLERKDVRWIARIMWASQ